MNFRSIFSACAIAGLFVTAVCAQKPAVATVPAVKQINEIELKELIKPSGKPLLINFWATWCDPCREEFPELVQLDKKYQGRIDLITISLDDLAEINTSVPKFLADMKAEMPAYLLRTTDENAAIGLVTNEWQGGLPFTILFDKDGKEIYIRQGKIKVETVSEQIDALFPPEKAKPTAISAPVYLSN